MMRILFLLILLAHHAYSQPTEIPPFYIPDKRCAPRCRFQFCGFRQALLIGAPNVVQKNPICRFGKDLKDIVEVGEASVLVNGTHVPISKWRPAGLDTPFGKRHFGVAEIPGYDNPGVFTKKPRGNQYGILRRQCIILPIEKYIVANFDGSPRTRTSTGSKDCLSFNVRTWKIIIEVEWLSGDDLDLSIREPDGNTINFRRTRSTCGFLVYDNCVDCCGIVRSARERVVYQPTCESFQHGEYQAIVRHAANCGLGETRWVLRLIVNGVVEKFTKGASDKDSGQFAGRMKFTL